MMGKSIFIVFSQISLSAPGAKPIQIHRAQTQTTFFLENYFFDEAATIFVVSRTYYVVFCFSPLAR
jgi:hypothetical protein